MLVFTDFLNLLKHCLIIWKVLGQNYKMSSSSNLAFWFLSVICVFSFLFVYFFSAFEKPRTTEKLSSRRAAAASQFFRKKNHNKSAVSRKKIDVFENSFGFRVVWFLEMAKKNLWKCRYKCWKKKRQLLPKKLVKKVGIHLEEVRSSSISRNFWQINYLACVTCFFRSNWRF